MPEKYSGDEWWANRAKFNEWFKEHPVVIPPEIVEQMTALQQRANEAMTLEEWQPIAEQIREYAKGTYQRLYQLRNNPGSSKSEIAKLEEELSDCYCGSGKKFIECHGA